MNARFATLVLFFAAHLAQAEVQYQLTDLGTLDGGYNSSSAQAINSNGTIAGYAYTSAFVQHAAIYANGIWTDLPALASGWKDLPYAAGLNDAGQTVGFGHNPANKIRAFFYSAGSFTDLGTLGGSTSTASAVNSEGTVVGSADISGDMGSHAFVWTATGGMIDLSTLGGNYSQANAINSSGTVVGASPNSSSYVRAFEWTSAGGITDLGTLGGASAQAAAINASGQIAGSSFPTGSTYSHAALYSKGVWSDLGTLGGNNSTAQGINSRGTVVGSSDTPSSGSHAFVYTAGAISDLNDLIASNSGWRLIAANAVNDSGQIAGDGVGPDGLKHGFLLTPTSPLPPQMVPAPVVKLRGKKRIVTTSSTQIIKGVASGAVTSVVYRIGRRGHWRPIAGLAKWKFKAHLLPGKNRVTVIAHGPGGDSRSVSTAVIRRAADGHL